MIEIDFKIDEEVLAEDLEGDIPNLDETFFLYSRFVMPVRMKIDDIDLFEWNNDPWCEAPIIYIASTGIDITKNLKIQKKTFWPIIEGPGNIELTMLDEHNVELDLNTGSRHVIVTAKYQELLEAFQKFANKVREFIWERVPQLNEHPYWGPWLRGERD